MGPHAGGGLGHLLQEPVRRHEDPARAEDRFDDDRGDPVALGTFQLGEGLATGPFVGAQPPFGGEGLGERQLPMPPPIDPVGLLVDVLTGESHGTDSGAMPGMGVEGHDQTAFGFSDDAPIAAQDFDRGLVGGRPRSGEVHPFEVTGGDRQQPSGELTRDIVVEPEKGPVGQASQLLGDGVDDHRVVPAADDVPQAGGRGQIAPPLRVAHPYPVTGDEGGPAPFEHAHRGHRQPQRRWRRPRGNGGTVGSVHLALFPITACRRSSDHDGCHLHPDYFSVARDLSMDAPSDEP